MKAGTRGLLFAIAITVGVGATALLFHLERNSTETAVAGLSIGQNRQAALDTLGGRGFYGWTCFRELAVYGDVPIDGKDHHAMAFLENGTDRVSAVEVAGYPVDVADPSQCRSSVRERAHSAFAHVEWADEEPGRYFIGGGNRYFVRQTHRDGRTYEVWADHRGAGSQHTCRVFWRMSEDGLERLEASGERRRRSALAAIQ